MPRQVLSSEQNETARKAFASILERKGFKRVCQLKSGTTYWRHKKREDHIVMLHRDDKGQLRTTRL